MYAVIEAGGRQFRVTEGDVIRVPAHLADSGASVQLDRVLLVEGDKIHVGKPTVAGAAVEAVVTAQGRGEKTIIFKKKRRTKYRRLRGHRQDFTELRIDRISVG